MSIWIVGRRAVLPNGHEYVAEPFLAFESNEAAQEARDMIERVSSERAMIVSAPICRKGARLEPGEADLPPPSLGRAG